MQTDCQQVAESYTAMLYRLAFSHCRNRADAEDVVQEVFLKYLNHTGTFESEAHLRAWLIRVTVNASKDLFRSPWHSRCCSLEEVAEPSVLMPEESALVWAVLHLPAKYRVIVHLYYYEDYSTAEIAQIMGISESAVSTRLLRARKKLKETLGGNWNDDEP